MSASATSGMGCMAAPTAADDTCIFQRTAPMRVRKSGAASAIESAVRATAAVRSW